SEQALFVPAVTDGLADRIDVTGECRLRDDSPAPDRSQEIVPGHDPLTVLQQVDQEGKDLRPRGNRRSSTGGLPPVQVEHAGAEDEPHSVPHPLGLNADPTPWTRSQHKSMKIPRPSQGLGSCSRTSSPASTTVAATKPARPAGEQAMKIVVIGGSGLIGLKVWKRPRGGERGTMAEPPHAGG